MLNNEVVGDKDERGKALSTNVERGARFFCKIFIVCFLSVRYRSDSLYYNMAGTPSSPTQVLFDSQDFENAGIGHGNTYKFQTDIANVRSNVAPTKRELLGSLRKNFRYFRWMQHYRTN